MIKFKDRTAKYRELKLDYLAQTLEKWECKF